MKNERGGEELEKMIEVKHLSKSYGSKLSPVKALDLIHSRRRRVCWDYGPKWCRKDNADEYLVHDQFAYDGQCLDPRKRNHKNEKQ